MDEPTIKKFVEAQLSRLNANNHKIADVFDALNVLHTVKRKKVEEAFYSTFAGYSLEEMKVALKAVEAMLPPPPEPLPEQGSWTYVPPLEPVPPPSKKPGRTKKATKK